MSTADTPLEAQIALWRQFLRRRRAIDGRDVQELEDHLRSQVAHLSDSGLAADEAFLVAVKRMGSLDALSREFAREHSERLWKQLVVSAEAPGESPLVARNAAIAIGLAIAAAVTMKIPGLFGYDIRRPEIFYVRNASVLVLPYLGLYLAWTRGLSRNMVLGLGAAFAAAAVFANIHSFGPRSNTGVLVALHLPIALWLGIGVAYAAGRWFAGQGRMDFVRFSGERFIYYVLIGLGGGVFIGFTVMMFSAIGVDAEPLVAQWLLPCGATGAVLIASWLVDAKVASTRTTPPLT